MVEKILSQCPPSYKMPNSQPMDDPISIFKDINRYFKYSGIETKVVIDQINTLVKKASDANLKINNLHERITMNEKDAQEKKNKIEDLTW